MQIMLDNKGKQYAIAYNPKWREYYLKAKDCDEIHVLNYCPWCGAKLPLGLRNAWYEIYEKLYYTGEGSFLDQQELMPAEFFTDEWWKKRDL
jgi:hypothetical protein